MKRSKLGSNMKVDWEIREGVRERDGVREEVWEN